LFVVVVFVLFVDVFVFVFVVVVVVVVFITAAAAAAAAAATTTTNSSSSSSSFQSFHRKISFNKRREAAIMAVAPISGFHAVGLSAECKQRDRSTKPV